MDSRPPPTRPFFLPIISSLLLAKALLRRSSGRVDGFIVEGPVAGGHNAPPRKAVVDENGEPVYGEKDKVDLDALKGLGLPFWLAGGFGSADGLVRAEQLGAAGIQVGTLFAYCNESGMEPNLRARVIARLREGEIRVRTDARASPTGFPFKIVPLEDTMSEPGFIKARPRICDIGLLRHAYLREDGTLGYRCPSEPEDQYVAKGGALDDTVGRLCLCNALSATAGAGQVQPKTGHIEQPLVTSGDAVRDILPLVEAGGGSYSADDVIDYLLRGRH